MKKKATCKVCSAKFELKKENKYLAVETRSGLEAITKCTLIFECFDCPECGCQISVNMRMPLHEENHG